jgi:hypothetical protein
MKADASAAVVEVVATYERQKHRRLLSTFSQPSRMQHRDRWRRPPGVDAWADPRQRPQHVPAGEPAAFQQPLASCVAAIRRCYTARTRLIIVRSVVRIHPELSHRARRWNGSSELAAGWLGRCSQVSKPRPGGMQCMRDCSYLDGTVAGALAAGWLPLRRLAHGCGRSGPEVGHGRHDLESATKLRPDHVRPQAGHRIAHGCGARVNS